MREKLTRKKAGSRKYMLYLTFLLLLCPDAYLGVLRPRPQDFSMWP